MPGAPWHHAFIFPMIVTTLAGSGSAIGQLRSALENRLLTKSSACAAASPYSARPVTADSRLNAAAMPAEP
jgi:hypothetical protein